MPFRYCCLPYCKKKKITSQPRQLGWFWNDFVSVVENWEDFRKTDVVCGKHYAQIRRDSGANMNGNGKREISSEIAPQELSTKRTRNKSYENAIPQAEADNNNAIIDENQEEVEMRDDDQEKDATQIDGQNESSISPQNNDNDVEVVLELNDDDDNAYNQEEEQIMTEFEDLGLFDLYSIHSHAVSDHSQVLSAPSINSNNLDSQTMSDHSQLHSQVVNSQDISLFSQPSISIANSQSFSITSSQHSISSTTSNRRLTDIKSVSSTQKCCFLCKNKDERKSIPKTALKQVWQEKNIFLPHHNRTCSSHLNNGKFTHEALALIVATKSGILMSDDEIAKWIYTFIALALINAFCPPLLQNTQRHVQIAMDALARSTLDNEMKTRVRVEKLDRDTDLWTKASSDVIQDFPLLTIEDLEKLTLGIYQLSLAKQNTKKHLNEESEFIIEVNSEIPGVLRAKLDSRFASSKNHQLWIEYDAQLGDHQSITGYYCKCLQGARTVGMCAHVACVVWFFGYQRHQPRNLHAKKPRILPFLDAAEILHNAPSTITQQPRTSAAAMAEDNEDGDSEDEEIALPNVHFLRSSTRQNQ